MAMQAVAVDAECEKAGMVGARVQADVVADIASIAGVADGPAGESVVSGAHVEIPAEPAASREMRAAHEDTIGSPEARDAHRVYRMGERGHKHLEKRVSADLACCREMVTVLAAVRRD